MDDAELVRERAAQLIRADGRLRLRGVASDGLEGLRMIREESPEVLLLDVFMPHIDGGEVLRTLREERRQIRVVVLTARPTAELYSVISLAPDAILYKETLAERELCDELVAVAAQLDSPGKRAQSVASAIAACRPRLNERELMVLHRLAAGMQVQQIAMDLNGIATRTVELHLHSIRDKLEAPTNPAVVARAYEVGLLGGRSRPVGLRSHLEAA